MLDGPEGDTEYDEEGLSKGDRIRATLAAAGDELAKVPRCGLEFTVTRGQGADGRWNGTVHVTLGGERHGGSLADADDVAMTLFLETLGRYVMAVLESDTMPGTPEWTAAEAAAARVFAEALRVS